MPLPGLPVGSPLRGPKGLTDDTPGCASFDASLVPSFCASSGVSEGTLPPTDRGTTRSGAFASTNEGALVPPKRGLLAPPGKGALCPLAPPRPAVQLRSMESCEAGAHWSRCVHSNRYCEGQRKGFTRCWGATLSVLGCLLKVLRCPPIMIIGVDITVNDIL